MLTEITKRAHLAPPWPVPLQVSSISEETARVADAVLRFCAGQDLLDEPLFRSAFAHNAVLDFIQPASLLGARIDALNGLEQIASAILPNVARLSTSHSVTNTRVWIEGTRAKMVALVEAQHLPANDHSRHLLLKNVYWMTLRQDSDGAWLIDHMLIRNIWMHGDPTVLFG